MRHAKLTLVLVAVLAFGCRPDSHGRDDDGGGGSDADADADQSWDDGDHQSVDGQPGDSAVDPSCASGAEWVYLVDADYTFIRFQPDELRLTPIGEPLQCPGAGMGTPFSMSVDRNGVAWVLYNGGRIYQVSTEDASCQATSFVPGQSGFELFGMGFVSDAVDSDEETLHIAGGASASVGSGSSTLGYIDDALSVHPLAGMPGWPELTGTGEGELWGFFPDTEPPSVRQIDKVTAATPIVYDLEELAMTRAQAWAFAFWGGRFYIFLQRDTDTSTHVWRLDPGDEGVLGDETLTDVIPDTGYRIVGAGVSTCAPYVLI